MILIRNKCNKYNKDEDFIDNIGRGKCCEYLYKGILVQHTPIVDRAK